MEPVLQRYLVFLAAQFVTSWSVILKTRACALVEMSAFSHPVHLFGEFIQRDVFGQKFPGNRAAIQHDHAIRYTVYVKDVMVYKNSGFTSPFAALHKLDQFARFLQ